MRCARAVQKVGYVEVASLHPRSPGCHIGRFRLGGGGGALAAAPPSPGGILVQNVPLCHTYCTLAAWHPHRQRVSFVVVATSFERIVLNTRYAQSSMRIMVPSCVAASMMETRHVAVPRSLTFQRIHKIDPSSIGSTPRLSSTSACTCAAKSHGSSSVTYDYVHRPCQIVGHRVLAFRITVKARAASEARLA